MKIFWLATVFWALTGMGCVTTQHDKSGTGTIWKSHNEPPPLPVTPAQVQPENAHKVSQALWDEMDRQDQDELLKENAAKAAAVKK
jgi:hypothetical protein